MSLFHGYQTDDLATWVGMVDAFNTYERHMWTAMRLPLSPGLKAARTELDALIRRATAPVPGTQPNATSQVSQTEAFARIDVVTAARDLEVSPTYVRRLCLEGRLGAEKVRGSWAIDPVDVAIRAQRSGRK